MYSSSPIAAMFIQREEFEIQKSFDWYVSNPNFTDQEREVLMKQLNFRKTKLNAFKVACNPFIPDLLGLMISTGMVVTHKMRN